MKKNILADFSLFITAIIWGTGFVATKIALDAQFNPFFILFIRFLVAALILSIVFIKKFKDFNLRRLMEGSIVGVFLYLGFATQTIGLLYTTPSNNAFLTATNVIMVPFISWLLYKAAPKRSSIIAAILCFIGIGILTYKGGTSLSIGDLLTLLCALFFACHIVSVGYYAQKGDAYLLVIFQILIACVLSFISMLIFNNDPIIISDNLFGFGAIIYLGVFSTCIAFFIQNVAQQYTSSTKTAIFLSTESVFGTLFSVMMGYENVTINMFIGGLIIFVAIIFAETGFKFFSRKAC